MTLRAPIADIGNLRRACATASSEVAQKYGDRIDAYRTAVREGVQMFTARLEDDVLDMSARNPTCERLAVDITAYLDWLQWTFWDLPSYALCLDLPDDRLRTAVRTCGMAYLSLRLFDDVIDRHLMYKGRHPTLFSSVASRSSGRQRPEGLTILAGLLVGFRGLGELARSDDLVERRSLERCLEGLQRATVGAIMEMSPREEWSRSFYERMTALKNVDFWRVLYAGLDPDHESPLYPFLERYYLLAQKLNDVQDFAEDERRGQPNLVSLMLPRRDDSAAAGSVVPDEAERIIAAGFLELADLASGLPERERLVALAKLGESLEDAHRLGIFAADDGSVIPADDQRPLGLEWYSSLDEIVARRGAAELIDASCAICRGTERRRLFEKQGFGFYRCACGHIYVSPQISSAVAFQLGQELDVADHRSRLMEVQKLFAAPVCHLLRSRAPGPRLLDIGFGQGWILRLARSYGFDPYGIETSHSQMDALRPFLDGHLHLAEPGRFGIPWDGFDAVIVSHVLEHLADPALLLGEVFRVMNPDAVLYVAVPDMESLQFRVFGKRWEVVSPLAHMQYFSEATLRRLLHDACFVDVERIEHAPIVAELAPRWMRLVRELGGTDAGEMAFVGRRAAL